MAAQDLIEDHATGPPKPVQKTARAALTLTPSLLRRELLREWHQFVARVEGWVFDDAVQ
jgi:hypothetical protein